jgi:hypothetical protein
VEDACVFACVVRDEQLYVRCKVGSTMYGIVQSYLRINLDVRYDT